MRYKTLDQIDRKYLIFAIQDKRFSIPINSVVEIIGYAKPEKIPNTWEYIEGILIFRENVCPIMNLQVKFNIKKEKSPSFQQIIVINNSYGILGIISNAVQEIKKPEEIKIFSKPGTSADGENDDKWFRGGVKVESGWVPILDLDKILDDMRIINISELKILEELDSENDSESKGGSVNESL